MSDAAIGTIGGMSVVAVTSGDVRCPPVGEVHVSNMTHTIYVRVVAPQCGVCGAFIKAANAGRCSRCGSEWDNGE